MTNRIREIHIQAVRLDPYEAEVRITVLPERVTPTTAVRSKLVGPRSAYARTLEVAYPLALLLPSPPLRGRGVGGEGTADATPSPHPLSPSEGGEGLSRPALTCRVVIPEPSFWDPETPFLYEGLVELW